MRFDEFLFHAGWLTYEEFTKVSTQAVRGSKCSFSPTHFLRPTLKTSFDPKSSSLDDLSGIRPRPFGEVLEKQFSDILKDVLSRSGEKDLSGLLNVYYKWHAYQVEPVSSFRQCSEFGRRLYSQDMEKRTVARCLADGAFFSQKSIVRDGDYVYIPEGSSGLFAGIAIIAYRNNIHILTSSGALIREIFENEFLQSRVKGLTALGGHAQIDFSTIGTGGRGFVVVVDTFQQAVKDPGATVVVNTVSALLPSSGPFAPTAEIANKRADILDYAFNPLSNLREIVFIADWTKHLPSHRDDYGFPIFNPDNRWKSLFAENRSRTSIVTCPPEDVRKNLESQYQVPKERAIRGANISPITKEYGQSAIDFDSLSRDGGFSSRFFEAVLPANAALKVSD